MIRQKPGIISKNKHLRAQVSLELVMALTCVLILVLGTVRVFVWLNQRLVFRQEAYENSRAQASSSYGEYQVSDATLPGGNLNILGK